MYWWRFGLTGAAALALALATPQAAAQTPEPPLAATTHILLDPRLPPETAAAIAGAAEAPDAVAPRWLLPGGECATPAVIAAAPGPVENKPPFDLDAALRAAAQDGASSVLVVASGRSECLSIACTLAASLAKGSPAIRIDVLATTAEALPLQCIAENSGGFFNNVAPDAAAAATQALLTARLEAARAAKAAAAETPANPPTVAGSAAQTPETAAPVPASPPGSTTAAGSPALATGQPQPPSTTNASASSPGGGPPIPRRRPESADAPDAAVASSDPASGNGSAGLQPFAWTAPPVSAPEPDPLPGGQGPGVQIRMLAGPAGPLVTTDLRYEVLSPAGDGTFRRIIASDAISPYFALRNGDYIVRVSHGEVVREFPFTVDRERTALLVFSLDIGYVSLRVKPTRQAAPLESGISYRISKVGGASTGAAVMRVEAAQPMVALPAGRYRVVGRSGDIQSATKITVEPGATVKYDFKLRLGYLRVSVPSDPEDVTLQIEAFSTAGTETTRVLAAAKGSTAMFRLQEGSYIAVALHGTRKVMQVATVTQGKLTELALDMPTAAQEPPLQD